MGLFSLLGKVYDLDTLDTRFTNSPTVPYKTVVDARKDPDAAGRAAPASRPNLRTQPSKWNTPEFYLYYAVFIVVVPYMFWIAYDVSRRMSPEAVQASRQVTDRLGSFRSALLQVRAVIV